MKWNPPIRWFAACFWVMAQAAVSLAQPSLIETIQQTKPSLVSVQSDITGYVPGAGGQTKPALDPRTGRIVVGRRMAVASYRRYGAGVIVHPAGVVVTNAHTVNKATGVQVMLHDSTVVPAKIVRFINNIDLAILQINAPYSLQPVVIADSDELKLRDEIVTVGNSTLLKQSITSGNITGLGTSRTLENQGTHRTDLIQTSINLYEGDSGGPLFDRKGQLVGLMVAKETTADHSSFAIPSNKIMPFLVDYLQEVQGQP